MLPLLPPSPRCTETGFLLVTSDPPPAPLAGHRPCTFPNPDVTCHPVMFHSEYLLLLQTPFFLLRRHSLSPGLLLHMWLLCPLHVISVLGLLLT